MMTKSLKWSTNGNKSSSQQQQQQRDDDHPKTVEFPQPQDKDYSAFLDYLGGTTSTVGTHQDADENGDGLHQQQSYPSLTSEGDANNCSDYGNSAVCRTNGWKPESSTAALGLPRISEAHSTDGISDGNNSRGGGCHVEDYDLPTINYKPQQQQHQQLKDLSSLRKDVVDDYGDYEGYAHSRYSARPSMATRESDLSSSSETTTKMKIKRRLSGLVDRDGKGNSERVVAGGGGAAHPSSQPHRKDSQEENNEPEYDVRAAFEKEHKAVRKFKVVVVLVLVAAAIAVSAIVYRFTYNGERHTLETEYKDYADKFITNFHHLQVMRQWAAYTVASTFTARCANNYDPEVRPWPNITLTDFADQVRGALVLAHGVNIEFSPLFENNETIRKEWEAYALENEDTVMHVPEWAKAQAGHGGHGDHSGHEGNQDQSHINEASSHANGHDMKVDETHEFGPDMNDATHVALTDHDLTGSSENHLRGRRRTGSENNMFDGSHSKQLASLDDSHHNHSRNNCASMGAMTNHGEHPRRPIEEGIYTMNGHSVVDETASAEESPYLAPAWHIFPLIGNEGRVMYNEYSDCHRRRAINTMLATGGPALTEVLLGAVDFHHFFKDPSSIMTYPVHNSFDEKAKIVGFVSIVYSWIGTFWNVLPENIKGVIAVVETSTGQKTSFRIDGKHATFLGEGDYHEEKWDHMKESSSVYKVYAKENNVKEMVGHHLLRHLGETMGHASMDKGGEHISEDTSFGGQNGEHIDYIVHVYPSDDFEECYLTSQPKIFSLAVSLVFFVTACSFIVYDFLVERRQKKLLENAERNGKIVSSLFPAMVRERLFHHSEAKDEERMTAIGHVKTTDMKRIKKFKAPHQSQQSQGGDSDTNISGSAPPIADLYHDTTVMFADIAGFTAWSSEREPTQVFQLLESLFFEFDSEAKTMKVFKIETIGDCYVAVTGLPEPNPSHAACMAKFAQRCLLRFSELTKELELSLGPGTADLGIRIGLHSGPVTAGVLRGEKARFQLFGDTMNTASRMESTSIKNMIQVTADTAALLKESGKGHSLIEREGLVKAKGKGYMQTYWLRPKTSPSSVSSTFSESNLDAHQASQHEMDHIHLRAQHDEARAALGLPPSFSHQVATPEKSSLDISQASVQQEISHSWNETGFNDINKNGRKEGLQRLIKWNTAVLESILTKVVIQNNQRKRVSFKLSKNDMQYNESALFHEEIAQAVDMPRFDHDSMSSACLMPSKEKVNLIPPKAREELRAYVARIASMYRDVHFHSFFHASHVTMSAQKLINKVVLRNSSEFSSSMSSIQEGKGEKENDEMQKRKEADLFFSTYGISADPLAQFAVVFAALVHDVEHRGIPNVQLIKEKPTLGSKYKNKSVAENNSIRVAWSELLRPEFSNLRQCIFASDDDESRFRQLLINVVIATDITDRERRAGERERWEAAFRSGSDDFNWEKEWQNKSEDELLDIDVSLKATVVLEQIVLASDVAHTMQHWLTYVKWNERLYKEMWAAYAAGRAEKDPTEGWYKGEIGFFDGYIIPLATKLKECGVFGNAGDEYLGNALRNKAEWIEKGQAIVNEFEAKIKRKSFEEKSVSSASDKSLAASHLS